MCGQEFGPKKSKNGFFRKPLSSEPTKHLFVANCGPAVGIAWPETIALFESTGALETILLRDAIVCASFQNEAASARAKSALESEEVRHRYGRAFVVRYADYIAAQVRMRSCIATV